MNSQYLPFQRTPNIYSFSELPISIVSVNSQYLPFQWTPNIYRFSELPISTVSVNSQYLPFQWTPNIYRFSELPISTVSVNSQYLPFQWTPNIYRFSELPLSTVSVNSQYLLLYLSSYIFPLHFPTKICVLFFSRLCDAFPLPTGIWFAFVLFFRRLLLGWQHCAAVSWGVHRTLPWELQRKVSGYWVRQRTLCGTLCRYYWLPQFGAFLFPISASL